MSEVREGSEDDEELESQPNEGGSDKTSGDDSDGRPFIPGADAGTTQADKYSRDEKEHGRQDHGP
jgi:hypothetical protein